MMASKSLKSTKWTDLRCKCNTGEIPQVCVFTYNNLSNKNEPFTQFVCQECATKLESSNWCPGNKYHSTFLPIKHKYVSETMVDWREHIKN